MWNTSQQAIGYSAVGEPTRSPLTTTCFVKGLLAASPEIRAGNWREGFPRVYHALDDLLVSGEGQEKAAGWGGGGRVDGIGMGSTIVTALLDRKRRQVPLKCNPNP